MSKRVCITDKHVFIIRNGHMRRYNQARISHSSVLRALLWVDKHANSVAVIGNELLFSKVEHDDNR